MDWCVGVPVSERTKQGWIVDDCGCRQQPVVVAFGQGIGTTLERVFVDSGDASHAFARAVEEDQILNGGCSGGLAQGAFGSRLDFRFASAGRGERVDAESPVSFAVDPHHSNAAVSTGTQ